MDKKIKLPKMRIPLPKQRCQAFKDKSKYDRKRENKGGKNNLPSFLPGILHLV